MAELREYFEQAHTAIAEAANATHAVSLENESLTAKVAELKIDRGAWQQKYDECSSSSGPGGTPGPAPRPFTFDVWGERPDGAPEHPAVRYFHFPRDEHGNTVWVSSSTASMIGQWLAVECAVEERPVICLLGAGEHGLDAPGGVEAWRHVMVDVLTAYIDAGGPPADWQFDSERWQKQEPDNISSGEWAKQVMEAFDDGIFCIVRGYQPTARICCYDFDRRWNNKLIDHQPWRGGTHYAPHFYGAREWRWGITGYVRKWAEHMLDNRIPCLPWLLRPGQRVIGGAGDRQTVDSLREQVEFLRGDDRWRCEGVQLWGDSKDAELTVADVEGIVALAAEVNA